MMFYEQKEADTLLCGRRQIRPQQYKDFKTPNGTNKILNIGSVYQKMIVLGSLHLNKDQNTA